MSNRKRATIPKALILNDKAEINRLFRKGTVFRSRCFNLIVLSIQLSETKVLLGASQKIKTKVAKNRAKRKLREIMRTRRSYLGFGIHLAIIAKPLVLSTKFADLEKEFVCLMRDIATMKN